MLGRLLRLSCCLLLLANAMDAYLFYYYGIDVPLAERDKPNVQVTQMSIISPGRSPMTIDLTSLEEDSSTPRIYIKEGAPYHIQLGFYVNYEIVSGLRYHQVIKYKGIKADKRTSMMGSFGPREGMQIFNADEEEAPKGMMYRGVYLVNSKVIDDEKVVHAQWDWELYVGKDW